jgi:hypothetical protein
MRQLFRVVEQVMVCGFAIGRQRTPLHR